MALVVFLRGLNVGGHRRLRPSVLAGELRKLDAVNVGAAGTFVVRRPGSRTALREEIARKLPFEAHIVVCDGREILDLEAAEPFPALPPPSGIVRFVSVLPRRARPRPLPLAIPDRERWLVHVLGTHGRFVYGEYRRRMETIRRLGEIDGLFGAPATTRGWDTIRSIAEILKRPSSR